MPERPLLTSLTEAQRTRAQQRFAVLRPHLEDGVPLPSLARQHGVHERTLERWLARYRQEGLAGLVRRPRADRGGHHVLVPELVGLIEGLALRRPPPTAAFVHRQAVAVAARQGWPVPSYRTVASLIAQLDPALVTLAHAGTRAYRDAYDLILRREASRPNELWQADHTPLNIWLLDERGQPARPLLSIILDDYSRAVAGYGLGFWAPSALQTALVLRQCQWPREMALSHIV